MGVPLGGTECVMRVPLGDVEWYDISWQLCICRLLCHSMVPSVRSACHSVASSGMAMRQGVYGAAQGPSKRQVTPNGSVAAMAPSLPAKRNTLTRLRELVWVGGCVTARAAWASPPGRRHRSVHRLAKMAPRRRFGAFVYTVGLRGSCERRWGHRSVHKSVEMASRRRFGAFVYTVGLLRCCGQPWRLRSVHRLAKMAPRSRFGAFVYTVGLLRCCEQPWGRNSVHRSAKTASPRRFGAFVYTVAPRVAT